MHIFLDDNINNDIYDGLPNEDNQNSINDDAKIFIDNLKEKFKKRIGELMSIIILWMIILEHRA